MLCRHCSATGPDADVRLVRPQIRGGSGVRTYGKAQPWCRCCRAKMCARWHWLNNDDALAVERLRRARVGVK